jgi:hypothetical protein
MLESELKLSDRPIVVTLIFKEYYKAASGIIVIVPVDGFKLTWLLPVYADPSENNSE